MPKGLPKGPLRDPPGPVVHSKRSPVADKRLMVVCYKSLTAHLCSRRGDVSVTARVIVHPHIHCAAQGSDPKSGLGPCSVSVLKSFLHRTICHLPGASEFIQGAHLRETSHLVQIVSRTRPVISLELLRGDPSFLLSVDFVRVCLLEETQICSDQTREKYT